MVGQIRDLTFIAAALGLAWCWAAPAQAIDFSKEPSENVPRDAAEFSAREIATALFKAKPGDRISYAGRDLTYLDLSGLNFKQASLSGSDLYGADLTGSDLKGVDLSHSRLDRAVLIRADLSGANLEGTTIYRPTIYSDLAVNTADAPRFSGANLARIKVQAELSGADFRGANLTEADFTPLENRPGTGTLTTMTRNVLKYCDFSGATLRDAKFHRAVLWFARMTGADLRNADLSNADLSRADFSGADMTGANVAGADFDGANLAGAHGLETLKGLDKALNLDKASR